MTKDNDDGTLLEAALDEIIKLTGEFEKLVIGNAYVQSRPELRAFADDIGDRLGDLYQKVGATMPD